MIKKSLLLCACLLLCGCQFNPKTLSNDLKSSLQTSSEQEAVDFVNMNKRLYSYYLPRDVGRVSSTDLSSVLKKDGVKMIMNFNPNSIVIRDYYYDLDRAYLELIPTKVVKKTQKATRYEGSFKKNDGKVHNYSCVVEQLENQQYFLFLNLEFVYFYTICDGAMLESLSQSMFQIAKSFKYDADAIVSEFSLKSSSEYLTENLDELTQEIPENGYLSDLVGEQE